MAAQGERIRRWLDDLVEKFRQQGAVSPDKAMTAEELGLPPGFKEAMDRRLGRSGIFVEVDGKYYLSEERLKQIEMLRDAKGGGWNARRTMLTLRMVQMIMMILFVTILLVNVFVQSWEIRIISIVLLVIWLSLAIVQFYYTLRFRRKVPISQQASPNYEPVRQKGNLFRTGES